MSGAEDGAGKLPSLADNLVGALAVVISTMADHDLSRGRNASRDFRGLRRACRALCGLHDQAAVREVHLCSCRWPVGLQPPSPASVDAFARGLLARGGRPTTVSLQLPCCTSDEETAERSVLALLDALRAGAAPISRVTLGGHTPVTEAVARAVADLSPALSHLHYWYCTHGRAATAAAAAAAAAATATTDDDDEGERQEAVLEEHGGSDPDRLRAALQLLLQLVGPRLRELDLHTNDLCWPSPTANPLPYCTALTRLETYCNLAEAGHGDGGLPRQRCWAPFLP